MAFSSKLGGEFEASKYVCVCERGLALGAYEGWDVFSFASVDVYSPCMPPLVSLFWLGKVMLSMHVLCGPIMWF